MQNGLHFNTIQDFFAWRKKWCKTSYLVCKNGSYTFSGVAVTIGEA